MPWCRRTSRLPDPRLPCLQGRDHRCAMLSPVPLPKLGDGEQLGASNPGNDDRETGHMFFRGQVHHELAIQWTPSGVPDRNSSLIFEGPGRRCFKRWRRMDERLMLSSSSSGAQATCGFSQHVCRGTIGQLGSIQRGRQCWRDDVLRGPFRPLRRIAPPTAPYSSSETTAEVLGWTTARTRAAPQMRKRQPLLVCGRRKQRPFPSEELPRLRAARTESTPAHPSSTPGSRWAGGTLCPPGFGHHGQRIPVCHVEEVVEKYLRILFFEI
ncbi:hypothetical protein GWK47_049018 [Chionoecetes opilio]|uniref:Uncharacterized protein n=1 Tax=Chionoecetes opilio TaxID=41210 RepID=A0A8J4Y3U8_CHIOP|nr:hypothetical protein GWK47_049018 [Chionoecetes opilio]